MPTLTIYRGDQRQQTLQLGEAVLRIGRSPENDVVLPDEGKGVSRVHAEIRFEAGHYVIADLNSQNGVWLGSRRVQVDTLPSGVHVSIGSYRLVMEDEPTTPRVSSDETAAAAVHADDVPPTLIDALTPPPVEATRPASPPAPTIQDDKRRPVALYGGVALAALVASVVVVIAIRRPSPQPAPPPVVVQSTTTVPPPPPVVSAEAESHLTKATEAIKAGDKATATLENAAAATLAPEDPRVSAQKAEIDSLPDPIVVPPIVAPDTSKSGDTPSRLASTLTVARRTGETPDRRQDRQKSAEGDLREGLRALKESRLTDAERWLRAAISGSGRPDFGSVPNEAQNALDRINDEQRRQADEQKRNAAEQLVREARQAEPTDVVTAVRKLKSAREAWPQTGLTELLNEWLERARVQGETAMTEGIIYDRYKQKVEALDKFERAVVLFELLPNGHPRLAEARRLTQNLKSGR